MQQPSRRQFLKTVGLASIAGTLIPIACAKKQHPLRNVICIVADDHSAEILGCYGNNIVRTPNLDRMAEQGVRFTHAYANAPVCSASRQSILTGKYPHAAGVTLLRTSFPEEQVTIAEHLKQYGFKTGVIGKTHFNNGLPHGFDYRITTHDYREHLKQHPPKEPPKELPVRPKWKPFRDHARVWLNSEMRPEGKYDQDTETTYLTNKVIDFLGNNQNERFCLWVGYHEPHSPFNFPIEYAGKYKPEDMPLPTGSPEDDRWVPEIFRDLTEAERRGIIAAYYTSTEYVDSKVGQILAAIHELGLDENTLVIYIGDQGYLLNDHKRFEKHTMWEQAIRSPLLINAGGRWGADRRIDTLTEFVDLAPTICEALGVPAMADSQGKSFIPVLNGETTHHKNEVFCEFLADNKAMIRTENWKYVFTSGLRDLGQGYATGLGPSGIVHKLYDLKNDPEETTNLAGKAELKNKLREMQHRLLNWFIATHPKVDELPAGLSLEAKLIWFCEPPDVGADLNAK